VTPQGTVCGREAIPEMVRLNGQRSQQLRASLTGELFQDTTRR
jgi:hypothetical protein